MNMKRLIFPYSVVVNPDGSLLDLYHGTAADFDRFDPSETIDGGLHFGTLEQARIRVAGQGKQLLRVSINVLNPQRSRDTGSGWKNKIRSAKGMGYDGIVYLNRYEGISQETIARADRDGVDLDRLSDKEFRKYAPEARDSWIAFNAAQVVINERIPYYKLKQIPHDDPADAEADAEELSPSFA
jgi:hypothetical protein